MSARDTYRFGTVTQTGPLRVRLDGDLAAVDSTPVDLVGDLHVGDRVWTQLHAKVLLVVAPAALLRGRRDSILELGRRTLSGGGLRKATGGTVSWTQRLISICVGKDNTVNPSGFFDIEVPPDGTVIPVLGHASQTQATVVGGAVPLANWQCLYYQLPLGQPSASVPGNFYIAGYQNEYDLPPDVVPVVLKQGDLQCYVFGDGHEVAWWKTPTGLGNGWSAYGSGYPPVQYKRENGFVSQSGMVKGGTVGYSPVFTLPEGYRPGYIEQFVGASSGGLADLRVFANGYVTVYGLFSGTNASVSLSTIRFPADQ